MILGILLALISGVISVVSKMLNFKTTEKLGLLNGTLVNYVVGALFSLVAILVLGKYNFINPKLISTIPFWLYCGGIFGLLSLILTIFSLSKVSVVYSTVLILIGQLGTGLLIDGLNSGKFSFLKLLGVALVIVGVAADKLCRDRIELNKASDL